jgi:hypothetical protein
LNHIRQNKPLNLLFNYKPRTANVFNFDNGKI